MKMPQSFHATVQIQFNATRIAMQGVLDESATLPEIKDGGKIFVDLDQVSMINSNGVRKWYDWIQRFKPPTEVILEKCPHLFVRNFSEVKGFITPAVTVASLYVPFYSEESGETVNFLAVNGVHFWPTGKFNFSGVKDSAGRMMEPDVVVEKYFAFLKL
jgi:hypothetical protein